MARVDVIMPQMGESIAEGTVSKWLKKIGDAIKRDEPIFEISTDKVDAEIPAPTAGTLAEILVPEGQTVAVQTVVARLETSAGVAVGDNGGADRGGAAARPAAAARRGRRGACGISRDSASKAAAPAATPPSRVAPGAPARPQPAGVPARRRQRPLAGGTSPHEVVTARPQDRGGARDRAWHADWVRHRRPRDQAGHRVPARGRRAGYRDARGRPGVPAGGGAGDPGSRRRPLPRSRGRATSWSPCPRCGQLISDHMVLSRRTSAHVTSFFEVDLTRVARIRAAKRAEFEAIEWAEADVSCRSSSGRWSTASRHSGGQRLRRRPQRHLSQAVQHRHRRGAGVGPDRAGHQARRRVCRSSV